MFGQHISLGFYVLTCLAAAAYIRCNVWHGQHFDEFEDIQEAKAGIRASLSFYGHYIAATCLFLSLPFGLGTTIVCFALLVVLNLIGDHIHEGLLQEIEEEDKEQQA